jgi:hypothetical protein
MNGQTTRCPHCGKNGISIRGLKPGDQFILQCHECHGQVSGGIGLGFQGGPAQQQDKAKGRVSGVNEHDRGSGKTKNLSADFYGGFPLQVRGI